MSFSLNGWKWRMKRGTRTESHSRELHQFGVFYCRPLWTEETARLHRELHSLRLRRTKIIAKNHQFFGVNNAYNAFLRREELKGKLGVFWHTYGSGKSYSMVMLARKIKHKCTSNLTFLIVSDREDLDTQIYKSFLRTELIPIMTKYSLTAKVNINM